MCRLCHSAYLRWIRHAKSGAQLFSHSGCVYNEATRFFRCLCCFHSWGCRRGKNKRYILFPHQATKFCCAAAHTCQRHFSLGFHFLCHIPIRAINSLVGSKSTRPATRARWALRLNSFLQLKAPCVTWNFSSGLIFVCISARKKRACHLFTQLCVPFIYKIKCDAIFVFRSALNFVYSAFDLLP